MLCFIDLDDGAGGRMYEIPGQRRRSFRDLLLGIATQRVENCVERANYGFGLIGSPKWPRWFSQGCL
jgi:hypothetical protein